MHCGTGLLVINSEDRVQVMTGLQGSTPEVTCGGLCTVVVKLLQSLDLSKTIVNLKRDLTSGFLVAEIMNRYHPNEIKLHTYENGTLLACKTDNLEQLYAMCKRKTSR
jgi:hypothetical protein